MNDLYQRVTSNIGIVRMAALQRWADHTATSLGCTVTLYGSALTSKKWRDLDVAVQWDGTPLNALLFREAPSWLEVG